MDYKRDLRESILSFWLNSAMDYKNGGLFTQLDEKGVIYGLICWAITLF